MALTAYWTINSTAVRALLFISHCCFAKDSEEMYKDLKCTCTASAIVLVAVAVVVCLSSLLGPVHTNPFSNENGADLLRFQKDLRPRLSFPYRFRPSTLQRRICLKMLLYPQCAWSNELDACAFQYIGPRNWRKIKATW